jgi:hypothetical protein
MLEITYINPNGTRGFKFVERDNRENMIKFLAKVGCRHIAVNEI